MGIFTLPASFVWFCLSVHIEDPNTGLQGSANNLYTPGIMIDTIIFGPDAELMIP